MREVVGVRVGVRGEIELELRGEDGCEGGGGLGGAGEGERLEGGLGVDVHVALVDGPARAERRARAAGMVEVVVLVGGDVGGGAGEGEEGVVVREEVGFGDAELEVEDVEELTLDAPDIPLAEDPGAERPVDVLQCRVVQVLQGGVSMNLDDVGAYECERTLFARMSAPRKTRSLAHCSRAIWMCGFARSM